MYYIQIVVTVQVCSLFWLDSLSPCQYETPDKCFVGFYVKQCKEYGDNREAKSKATILAHWDNYLLRAVLE